MLPYKGSASVRSWVNTLIVPFILFAPLLHALPLSQEPHRALYQIYVRAFFDGSLAPDGEGDFAGLATKLDYFADLGVDTLLLMPIFSSTGDMGYIPRDYFALDPAYGDDAAFRSFIMAAHARGIKIILDAPVNHISFDSPWFRRGSQKNCDATDSAHNPDDPDNRYCNFFYFITDPCLNLPYSRWHKPWLYDSTDCHAVWFQRPEFNPAFHRPELVYATFFSVMPDLKFWDFERHAWNEAVVQEVERFFTHWAAAGVDGFRIDAAKHFVEGDDGNNNPQEPNNKALLTRFLTHVRQRNPDISFIGEIWSGYQEIEPYLPQALDMILDFPFMEAVRASVGDNFGERFKEVLNHLQSTQDSVRPGARVVFAGNHDVSRMMSAWNDDADKWRLAMFLPLVTPQAPLIFYGEELGMHGLVKRPDQNSNEEYVRTINAFAWNGMDESVGFPGGIRPVTGLADNFRQANLEVARQDAQSTYHMVRQLLRLRRDWSVSPNTRLTVRQDLFGHVIGWTMSRVDANGNLACRSVLVNFNRSQSYTIEARHALPGCGLRLREVFREQAQRQQAATMTRYVLMPYAKVLVDN